MNEPITTFDEVEYEPLRTFNRCVMTFNLREDAGEQAAKDYLERIPAEDRLKMVEMYKKVKKEGPDSVRREIMLTMPLQDVEEV
jgi:hypothetical protein